MSIMSAISALYIIVILLPYAYFDYQPQEATN